MPEELLIPSLIALGLLAGVVGVFSFLPKRSRRLTPPRPFEATGPVSLRASTPAPTPPATATAPVAVRSLAPIPPAPVAGPSAAPERRSERPPAPATSSDRAPIRSQPRPPRVVPAPAPEPAQPEAPAPAPAPVMETVESAPIPVIEKTGLPDEIRDRLGSLNQRLDRLEDEVGDLERRLQAFVGHFAFADSEARRGEVADSDTEIAA